MTPRRQQPPPDPPPLGAERLLPHDLEAERAVLGAILLHPDAYDAAADTVTPADFFREAHRRLFAAFGRLADQRKPAELITLCDELRRTGDLDEVGGPMYITALVDGVPRSANIQHYCEIVAEKARLRAAITTGNRLVAQAYDGATRAGELVADTAEQLYALGGRAMDSGARQLRDLMTPAMEALERSAAGGGGVTGLPTGFVALDELTAGLQGGDLVVVAARTSQGKTALAMNIARYVAIEQVVLVFSMEMSDVQLFVRQLAGEAEVDSHRLRTGHMVESDWVRIGTALGALGDLKMFIDDRGGLGVREVRAGARQVKAKHGLGLVVVDYFQLMRGRGQFDNRTQELGTVSRGLKAVARELQVPVILLSQLSRNAEPQPGRKARRPQLSDLAECGSLENDADVVLFIYRPEPRDEDQAVIAEVIVGKQRNGPTGIVRLHWNAELVRFENLAP
jgi:replicative DNA helicase